jgi:hypothetical protein
MERLGLRFRLLLAAASGSLAFFSAGDIDAADKWRRRGLQLVARWAIVGVLGDARVRGVVRSRARSRSDGGAAWGAVDAFAQARVMGHWK